MKNMKRSVFLLITIYSLTTCIFGQEEKLPKVKPIIDLAGGTVIGKATSLPKPPFPSCKCKFSKLNRVSVQFVVNEKGIVETAEPVLGHPALKAASVAALRNSRFSISLVDNEPVKAYGEITYEFRIMRTRSKVSVLSYNLRLQNDK
jgi:hypothetical protein